MSSAPDSSFAPRPWPKRAPDASPLAGRRILLLDGDDALAAQVEAVLERASCTARRLAPQAALEELGHAGWEVLIAVGLDAEFSDTLAGLADAPPLIVIASEQDGEAQAWPPGVFAQLAGVPTDAQLLTTLGRALEQSLLQRENRDLRASLAGRYQLGNVMTRDPVLKDVLKTIETVADTRASVLLSGESGTGKTLLAHALHQHSSRASGPFVVVNCGSLPDTLLESELFGHVRGAFTGAVRDKLGRFEQADGGTLFLDEINSASLDLQVKLLRAIQDRTFERVGDSTTRSADVRIVTASNRDLEQEVAEGRFREDLYYRIHVVNLQLPPLRERSGDIALLAEHFLERAARTYDKAFDGITPACLAQLVRFPWPGNVRQLENAIERAVLLSSGPALDVGDLGAEFAAGPPSGATSDILAQLDQLATLPPLKVALEGPERRILTRALELNGGNRNATAEMLGINRTTLFNKMKKYGLMDLSFERP